MATLGDVTFGGSTKLPPPEKFSNRYEDWYDWSWKFKTYVGLYEPEIEGFLERCETSDQEITDADLSGADESQRAHAKKFCRRMQ